jgi:cytoskeletal protein RodZ
MSPETYYEILGISESADDDAVKQAFRDLAKHFHPDRNPNDDDAERQFKRINTAYEGLKDASRRQAYNEWLEFAHKREKVKRTQWGRLAALVFLLLLGPSAVLYWAVVIADIPLFADSVDKVTGTSPQRETIPQRETSLPPPRPERRPPLSAESAAPEQRIASRSEPAPQPASPPPVAEPARGPAPEAPPAPTAVTPSPPAKNTSPDVDNTSTQALPPRPTLTELLGASDVGTAREATNDPGANRVSPLPVPEADQPDSAEPRGDSARATARMLARLKEPQGAQSSTAVPDETPPAAEDTPPPLRDGLPPDTFADCDGCPVISAAGSNEMLGGTGKAAISLTEITLADWDGCVADRACPPYDRPLRGNRRETVVEVGPREAESYVAWLSANSGKNYRHVMSPRRREAAAGQRCNGGRRNNSGWEWLDDNSVRNCPPPTASETGPDAPRGFRVFRKLGP